MFTQILPRTPKSPSQSLPQQQQGSFVGNVHFMDKDALAPVGRQEIGPPLRTAQIRTHNKVRVAIEKHIGPQGKPTQWT